MPNRSDTLPRGSFNTEKNGRRGVGDGIGLVSWLEPIVVRDSPRCTRRCTEEERGKREAGCRKPLGVTVALS